MSDRLHTFSHDLRRALLRAGILTISGGDGDDEGEAPAEPTVADLVERTTRLAELDDVTLADTHDRLVGLGREIGAESQTAETVAALTQVREAVLAIRAEQSERESRAEDLANEATAALADIVGTESTETPAGEAPEAPAAETPEAAPVEPAPEAPAAESTETPAEAAPVEDAPPAAETETEEAPAEGRVPVLASTAPRPTPLERISARRPAAAAPRPAEEPSSPTYGVRMLNCDVNGLATGQEFASLADVARVFASAHDMIARSDARAAGDHRILSIRPEYPEERHLRAEASPQDNMAVVASAMVAAGGPNRGQPLGDAQAIVASGGLCAPVNNYYGQAHIGDNDRPVRASLPSFAADRGGIRFVAPVKLSAILDNQASAAITTVTMAQDAASKAKTKQTVTCPAITEVDVTAQAERLGFGNVLSRTFPERVQNILEVTMDDLSRVAERRLLTQIGAGSTSTSVALSGLGVASDFTLAVSRAVSAYRNRHRMPIDATLQILAPAWLLDAIVGDLTVGTALDVDFWELNDARVQGFFTRLGVDITWYRDGEAAVTGLAAQDFGAQSGLGAALVDYPDQAVWYLFHAGAWLYLDGGEINIGLVRDSTLNNTNDYEIMYEFFEDVAFVGLESIRVVQTFCMSGTRALGKDVSAGCTTKVGFGS